MAHISFCAIHLDEKAFNFLMLKKLINTEHYFYLALIFTLIVPTDIMVSKAYGDHCKDLFKEFSSFIFRY